MIKCDENCEECGKYTTLHSNYDNDKKVFVKEYDCLIADKKVKKERVGNTPRKVGVNADGTDKYESTASAPIPEHGSLKVYSSCPSWVK